MIQPNQQRDIDKIISMSIDSLLIVNPNQTADTILSLLRESKSLETYINRIMGQMYTITPEYVYLLQNSIEQKLKLTRERWYPQALQLCRLKQWSEALPILMEVTKIHPLEYEPFYFLAITLQNLHRDQEAISAFNTAINNGISNPFCLYYRALSFYNLKQYQESIEDLEIAIRSDYSFDVAYVLLAKCFMAIGNEPKYGYYKNRAFEINPNIDTLHLF